jgi:uncharacterized protein
MDIEATRPAPATPVSSSERVVLLDVLRGYALWGVLMSNVYVWFSGWVLMPPERMKELSEGKLRRVLEIMQFHLIGGKFVSIFAFLFGLGLAVQFGRAELRNDSAAKRYTRRAAALLGFGLVHIAALWYGDILTLYAQVGFLVLLFRRASPRTLLILGIFFGVFFPMLFMWGNMFLPKLWTSKEALDAAGKAHMARMGELHGSLLSAFSGESYPAIVKANVVYYVERLFTRFSVVGYAEVFGKMLLGYYAGKARLFHDADSNRKAFRRLLGWGLLTAILASAIVFSFRVFLKVAPGTEPPLYRLLVMPFATNLQTAGMACMGSPCAVDLRTRRAHGRDELPPAERRRRPLFHGPWFRTDRQAFSAGYARLPDVSVRGTDRGELRLAEALRVRPRGMALALPHVWQSVENAEGEGRGAERGGGVVGKNGAIPA